jgi:cell division protein ZapA
MASVTITVGGNQHVVACRDGEEAHLLALAAIVDAKAVEARGSVGGGSEIRQLLFAALLLADELNDARKSAVAAPPGAATPSPQTAHLLANLADHIESLATRLENNVKTA